MPKRKNKRRPDGLIPVQVYLGLKPDGKRDYATVYGRTQKEADEKADELKALRKRGLSVASRNDTFGEWASRWLKIKTGEVSVSQASVCGNAIKHLNRYLEASLISKIKPADIQIIISDLAEYNPNTEKPSAQKTLKSIKGTAFQIFQLAIDNRILDYNPVSAVRIPKTFEESPRRALTATEQRWITDTPHRAQRAAMIMMYAGLRRGELIPLLWKDIDLDARTVTVNKSVETIKGKFSLKNTAKTTAGIRVVDIPQRLADFLRVQPRESIYVCVSAGGKMHTPSSWDRMWDSYLTDLNFAHGDFSPFQKRPQSKFDPGGVPFVIPKITAHWLRHTFATMLYMAGVDILTAKEQLGHADIKTTLEIYTHLDAIHKRKAMNKLDDYLADASNMQVNGFEKRDCNEKI